MIAPCTGLRAGTIRSGCPKAVAPDATAERWLHMADALKLVSARPKDTAGVVASAAYAGGRRVAEVPIEDVGEWSRKPGHVVWIGLHEPGLDLLRRLQAEFGLHELAIEDALKAHQRPKPVFESRGRREPTPDGLSAHGAEPKGCPRFLVHLVETNRTCPVSF